MVDTATFRTFYRAPPGPTPKTLAEPAVAERPDERASLSEEALPSRFAGQLRARRQAVREESHEPEPAVAGNAEAILLHEPVTASEPSEPFPEAIEALSEPAVTPDAFADALEAVPDASALPSDRPFAHPVEAEPAAEVADLLPEAEQQARDEPLPDRSLESAAGWVEPIAVAPIPEADVSENAHPLPDLSLESAAGWVEPITNTPIPEADVSEDAEARSDPQVTQDFSPEPFPDLSLESAAGWVEPVPAADIPRPLQFRSDRLALDYQLLGLANPAVCSVVGKLGDAEPVPLSIGRTGIYRPLGFRPAPWSGFAYDASPDGMTGLVVGTRILTARGLVAVEELVPGDLAMGMRGPALLPIAWIGRSIGIAPPVQIAAGAFGHGRPLRALQVGADHPVFVQADAVPAHELVNGTTVQTAVHEAAELFHVDLGYPEVLLAEGLPLGSGCR